MAQGDKKIQEVMKDTLNNLTETINMLENIRLVISNVVNKDSKDFYRISEQVKKLNVRRCLISFIILIPPNSRELFLLFT